jgi:hypothetical protein
VNSKCTTRSELRALRESTVLDVSIESVPAPISVTVPVTKRIREFDAV